jgi:hypothetical protein
MEMTTKKQKMQLRMYIAKMDKQMTEGKGSVSVQANLNRACDELRAIEKEEA